MGQLVPGVAQGPAEDRSPAGWQPGGEAEGGCVSPLPWVIVSRAQRCLPSLAVDSRRLHCERQPLLPVTRDALSSERRPFRPLPRLTLRLATLCEVCTH